MAEIRTAQEMREACANIADDYDCLYADGRGEAVVEAQESIAAAIRALPVAPREVPEAVRKWMRVVDRKDGSLAEFVFASADLRVWLRKEFGI